MSSSDELRALFDEFSVLNLTERRARLAELREHSPALSTQLTGLLESDEAACDSELLDGLHARMTRTAGPMPKAIGQYEIVEVLGEGGMGRVYLAHHAKLQRDVALKVIRVGELACGEEYERFAREARATAQLEHPNIVQVYDYGEHEGQPFFTMALVQGENLAGVVASQVLEPRDAAKLILQVADAMHYAHGEGLIHRDIKPANIQLDSEGNARVTDFGLVRQIGTDSVASGSGILGTPWYMAPEQAAGKASVSVDIYAIGATLYHILTGRPPFQAATPMETIEQARNVEPVPPRHLNPVIPIDLETICLVCLEKSPAARYESAGALAEDLGCFLAGEPISRRAYGPLRRGARWARRRWRLVGVAAVILGALGIALRGYQAERSKQREKRLAAFLTDVGHLSRQLDARLLRIEGLVRSLAASARHCLEHGQPRNGEPLYLSHLMEKGKPSTFPPGWAPSPRHLGMSVSTEWPVLVASPDARKKMQDVRPTLQLLALLKNQLRSTLVRSGGHDPRLLDRADVRRLLTIDGVLAVWTFVASKKGVHVSYPAKTGYHETYTPLERPWYTGACNARDQVHWTRYETHVISRQLICCSKAFYGPGTEAQGVAAVDLDPHRLSRLLGENNSWRDGQVNDVALVDRQGHVVLRWDEAPLPQGFGSSKRPDNIPKTLGPYQHKAVRTLILGNRNGGTITVTSSNGKQLLVSYSRLVSLGPSLGWYLVVEADKEQILGR